MLDEITVFPESSLEIHEQLALKEDVAETVFCKPIRSNMYLEKNRSVISIIRSEDRIKGIGLAVEALGGLSPITRGVEGNVLVKVNANSDDPFPASTHLETVKKVVEMLLSEGINKNQIVIGDISGRGRGLPTRHTMMNMGLVKMADELGIRLSFFDEGEWLRIRPDKASNWPKGFRIPRELYEASRVISLPALKTHITADFTLSLKIAVGIINAAERNFLHNATKTKFLNMIAELNLAYTADLVVLDGMECFKSGGPSHGALEKPGIVIAGGDRVAVDAVGATVLKKLGAPNLMDGNIRYHGQIKSSEEIGLGFSSLNKIELRTRNLARDNYFKELVTFIKKELKTPSAI